MTCTRVKLEGGGVAIICTRGQKPRAKCAICGVHVHEKLCDFALVGKKAGKTCDRKMCANCATNIGDERDLCPPHAKAVRDAQVPTSVLTDPDPFAMSVVSDIVEQAGMLPAPPDKPARKVTATPEPNRHAFRPRDYDDWLEFYTERAGVAEFDGGLERHLAEFQARDLAGPPPLRTEPRSR